MSDKKINIFSKFFKNKDRNYKRNFTLIILNFIVLIFLIFQIFIFTSNNMQSANLMASEGRKFNIDISSSEVDLVDFIKGSEAVEETEDNIKQAEIEESSEPEEDILEEDLASDNIEIPEILDYSSANLGIILTEVGLTQESLEVAKLLPKEVSLAFSPYSAKIQEKIDTSISEGRETLLTLMFEPSTYPLKDSGPLTIQSHFEESQNIFRLQSTTSQKSGFKGFITNIDEIITPNLELLTPILRNAKEQDKFFIYFRQPVNSYIDKEAKPLAVDVGSVDFLIDSNPREKNIRDSLNLVKQELLERRRKVVIALRPYPNSIKVLNEWLRNNLGPNIQIAPISYFITDN